MRMLMSYWYYRRTSLDSALAGFQVPLDLFADSGAYSAHTSGQSITVDDYCDWIEKEGWRFSTYVNLDVIGDAEGTWQNQQRMEARGLTPVPVFHGGEPWEYLERYVDRYPYVALGGMGDSSDPTAIMRFCVKCFKTGQAAGTRFHGFGQTQPRVLRSLPWYSVDSSSWASAHRFGNVMLWDDNRARFVKLMLHDHNEAYRHASLIRAHGGDPAEVAHHRSGMVERNAPDVAEQRDVRARLVTMNARAWMRFEQWLRRHHGTIAAPEGYETKVYVGHLTETLEGDGGPKVYLVAPNDLRHPNGCSTAGLHAISDLDSVLGPKVYLALATGPKIYLASSGGDGGKLSEISGNLSKENT